MQRKTFIPNIQYSGGPKTFMNNFRAYLKKSELILTQNLLEADVTLFPVKYNISELKKFKRKNGKIIQRLDGVYYKSLHGLKYLYSNRNIKYIYKKLSNYVIFQSNYSKEQCFNLFGEIPEKNYSIITNGVDKSIFYANNSNKTITDEVRFITTGRFRKKDMIEPIIRALDLLNGSPAFKLIVIGKITNPRLKKYFKREYIDYKGELSAVEIAKELRNSHIFLYSFLNPPCPNSVIEAISCGLPVVGYNTGAMSELLFFSRHLLTNVVGSKVFTEYKSYNFELFSNKIKQCVLDYEKNKLISLQNANMYSFEETGFKYESIIKKMLEIQ